MFDMKIKDNKVFIKTDMEVHICKEKEIETKNTSNDEVIEMSEGEFKQIASALEELFG